MAAIRLQASAMRSLGCVNVMRAYPSPYFPKPSPGVTATPDIEEFSNEFHRIAFAVNPNIEGCFWLFNFVAKLTKRVD